MNRLEVKRGAGTGRWYVALVASFFLARCVVEAPPSDQNAGAADAPREIIIRNATSAPVEYSVLFDENEDATRVLRAGSIDRHPTEVALDITFESNGKHLVYQLDPGRAYAFRHDLHDNLDLYVGSHTREDAPDLAPFVPTPNSVVDRMLELAEVDESDVLIDLGCGDGRIVIAAAKEYGARGIGVDIDAKHIEKANRLAKVVGVGHLVEFRVEDATRTDLSPATVVCLYLTPDANELIRPRLERQLEPGSRVITHDYPIPTWKAVRQESIRDGSDRTHQLYLYVIGK